MGMFDKLLPAAGTGVAGPGINMNDPRVAAAVQLLKSQGVPLNRANIAEAIATMDQQQAAPAAPAAPDYTKVQGGPSSDIVKRLEAEAAAKRMQGPPPEMLRSRRGMMQ